MEKKESEYKYLKRGDYQRIAKELNVTPQKVRDIVRRQYKDRTIQLALEKLNEARRIESETLSDQAVKNIINQ